MSAESYKDPVQESGNGIAFLLGTLNSKMDNMITKFENLIEGDSGLLVRVRDIENQRLQEKAEEKVHRDFREKFERNMKWVLGFIGCGVIFQNIRTISEFFGK